MIDRTRINICYYLANIVLTIKVMLASSSLVSLNIGDSILAAVYLGLIMVKLVYQRYSIKDLVLFSVIGVLAIYTCFQNNNFYLMFSCLGCFAIKGIDFRRLLKYRCWTKLIIILIHVLYTLMMFAVDFQAVPTVVRNGEVRYFFYLGQPNTCQMYVLWTTLEFLFLYFHLLKDIHLLTALAINGTFFLFTDSNSSMIVLGVTLLLVYLAIHQKQLGHHLSTGIVKYGYGIIALALFLMVYFYAYSGVLGFFLQLVNKAMTGRLAYGAYAFTHGGLTFFGSRLNFGEVILWNGQWYDALYLDSAYLALMLQYGIVWILIIGYGIYKCAGRKDILMNIFLSSYVMYGIMESYVLDASVCFPILFIGMIYFDGHRSKRKGSKEKR